MPVKQKLLVAKLVGRKNRRKSGNILGREKELLGGMPECKEKIA